MNWHYTPPSGWINDPNGLLFDGTAWHLFAQHTPGNGECGPKHWIHAVSEDLLRWRDLGVALAPEALGEIWSGSAVTHGGQMIAMYTHHGECEQQSLAFSDDGIHFTPYAQNPVITNPGLQDFRDPKVFRNELAGGWGMVLAAGDELRFYRSADLLQWEQTGAFGKKENQMGGVFECPDLFHLPAPDGSDVWVLSASMGIAAALGGCKMQYFLGTFDGETFHQTILSPTPLLMDFGADNYAAIAFFDAEPVQIGWAGNWAYTDRVPLGSGCMTLARRLSLVQTKQGLRLAWQPVLPVLDAPIAAKNGCALPEESFVLDITAPGDFSAALVNDAGERFAFGCAAGMFFADRTGTGALPFSRTEQIRLTDGPITMRLVFERTIAELYADVGTYACTTRLFPAQPYTHLELTDECSAKIMVERP